jgi:tyrosyl-tRNA synthetase
VESKSEARRLISQGAVEVGGKTKKDPNEKIAFTKGDVVKIGKKRFFRVA